MLEFEPFPKIGRINATATITEKIDGTNAQIQFDGWGGMLVGSRKREIHPEGSVFDLDTKKNIKGTDNFGFAKWAYDNQSALYDFLGLGRHYGEWAGHGIQREYGLEEKRFFLFNSGRFGPGKQEIPEDLCRIGLDTVPVLYDGPLGKDSIEIVMHNLKKFGSRVNHYVNPEGVIVYLHGSRTYFKDTYEYRQGKGGDR